MGAIIRGLGVSLPDNILTNADLERMVETSDEWIVTRTGIRERRILPKGSPLKASDLGAAAALQALERAGVRPDQVGGILVGGIVPDMQFPATACIIQEKIGAKNAFAFDITAACSGFVYGVNMAALLIDAGQCEHVLVIGAETLSRVTDWTDRNTCVLFGDAGAAAVLSRGPEGRGVIRSVLRSDGGAAGILNLDSIFASAAGASPDGAGKSPTIRMDGKQVFKLAVSEVAKVVTDTLALEGLKPSDLDLFVAHQANVRILSAIGDKLGLPEDKVFVNVHRYGNTSAASVPLALYEAEAEGRLKPGMLVGLAAVGGGMAWGCNLIRW
jgi:3-oxoacyl-[acyl-carrier-protein] synthase-3